MKKFIYAFMAFATLCTMTACDKDEYDIDTEGYTGTMTASFSVPAAAYYTQESVIVKSVKKEYEDDKTKGEISVTLYAVKFTPNPDAPYINLTLSNISETSVGSDRYEAASLDTQIAEVPTVYNVVVEEFGNMLKVDFECAYSESVNSYISYTGYERD